MALTFDDITPVFQRRGDAPYSGEPVTPTEHALQTAWQPDAQRSLALQGGVFTAEAAQAFITRPHAHDALPLRLWGDLSRACRVAL
jgi:predicted HD phosphohydrolase